MESYQKKKYVNILNFQIYKFFIIYIQIYSYRCNEIFNFRTIEQIKINKIYIYIRTKLIKWVL